MPIRPPVVGLRVEFDVIVSVIVLSLVRAVLFLLLLITLEYSETSSSATSIVGGLAGFVLNF